LDFINKLRPVKYKLNSATSPRYHYGLIAQEITSSLSEHGLTTSDVGFIASASLEYTDSDVEEWKTKPNWNEYEHAIASSNAQYLGVTYEEFISPMIKAIQQLSDRVSELELKISGSI
jgi:hypothetical protein